MQTKHFNLIGDPGGGKSHFASTLQTPQIIIMYDPFGKDTPYLRNMRVGKLNEIPISLAGQLTLMRIRDIYQPDDKDHKQIVRKIFYCHDHDPKRPTAYLNGVLIFDSLRKTIDSINAKTVILDSITTYVMSAKKYSQKIGTGGADPRAWARDATDYLEDIQLELNSLNIDTCTIAHIHSLKDEQQGVMVYTAFAPGRMAEALLSCSSDVYRCFVRRNSETQKDEYKMQVSHNGVYVANNSFGIQGEVANNYVALSAAGVNDNTIFE